MEDLKDKQDINMKNKINLKECFCNGVKPEIAYEYVFHINEGEFVTKQQLVTGNELHELLGTSSDTHFIKMKTNKGKIDVGPLVKVDLTENGIERFIIRPYKQSVLDLEDYFNNGSIPYITYKYLLKINRAKFEVEDDVLSREEILQLVGKDPKTNRLRMFTKNGKRIVNDGEVIDLTECGVERFITEALDCKEGFVSNIKQLTIEDNAFLEKLNVVVVKEGRVDWLIFRGYEIPEGYNVTKSDVSIMIPPHYPTSQLDMFYFYPPLVRKDGKSIGAITNKTIEGKVYQRWSRHRTLESKWDSNIDNIETHLDLMKSCLKLEFSKR
ncbi:multiubiquitin domain-containing protein [Wenyingzhuangia sp. IMCC45533]